MTCHAAHRPARIKQAAHHHPAQEAGAAQHHGAPGHSCPSVTAPRAAEPTCRAYFASTPRSGSGRGVHCARRRSSSASGHVDIEPACAGVDGDGVSLLNQRNGTAHGGLRGHMTDHHAVGAPGETPVGDQPHAVAQTRTDDGRGGGQHLAHPRPALRALVADHQHVAGMDVPAEDGLQARLLGIEHARRTGDLRVAHAADLGHRPFRGQVAPEHGQVAAPVHRFVPGADHRLAGGRLSGNPSSVSARVRPVTVRQSP
jgi:hypothetical protein